MIDPDEEAVQRKARQLIAQHGMGAAQVALDRLNESIDREDWYERDVWARVVRAIHEQRAS
jgi:hypothetical protein